ncbi:hypothetical protein [Hahella sp. CCB-MM4]|uniref:hypothetical protein n=1 Tax=Hahella sp. (strain CCB-MM4) TaxID=1926491 RepID=UPI0011403867|nr:hypothetical protein [Hahella sp. CCB-MM4]
MNKLVFRVAVSVRRDSDYIACIPGMLVCGMGTCIESTLENTRSIIAEYISDSAQANSSLGPAEPLHIQDTTWHQVEVVRSR